MDEIRAVEILAALGNEKRLQIFRLLVQAGHGGLNISEIQLQLVIPPSTLAHHISALVKGGLVSQDKIGREIICKAKYETMENVFTFMMDFLGPRLEGEFKVTYFFIID